MSTYQPSNFTYGGNLLQNILDCEIEDFIFDNGNQILCTPSWAGAMYEAAHPRLRQRSCRVTDHRVFPSIDPTVSHTPSTSRTLVHCHTHPWSPRYRTILLVRWRLPKIGDTVLRTWCYYRTLPLASHIRPQGTPTMDSYRHCGSWPCQGASQATVGPVPCQCHDRKHRV